MPPACRSSPTSRRSAGSCASITPRRATSRSTSRRSVPSGRVYRGETPFPTDPFSGESYNWVLTGEAAGLVYSAGPDAETATDDDIDYALALAAEPES